MENKKTDKEETYEKTKNNKKVFLNTTYEKEKHNIKHENKTIAKNQRYYTKTQWSHIKTQALKLEHIPRQKREKTGKITHKIGTKKYTTIYKCTQKHYALQKKKKKPKK
jgi:hypothetical protein